MTYFQPPAIVVPTPFQPPVLTQSPIKGGLVALGALPPLLVHCVTASVNYWHAPLNYWTPHGHHTAPTAPHSRATWFHCPTIREDAARPPQRLVRAGAGHVCRYRLKRGAGASHMTGIFPAYKRAIHAES
jgi:hypothetical protein